MKAKHILGAVIGVVIGIAVIASVYPIGATIQDDNLHEEVHTVVQVDIDKTFAAYGQPGFFKLLIDYTDMRVAHGHVAISNVQCDANGISPFVLVVANANVGAGNTQLAILPLDTSALVNDVSFPGKYCTYHVDINDSDYDFPVTDIALANSSAKAVRPHSTASATIHADIVEMMEEGGGEH